MKPKAKTSISVINLLFCDCKILITLDLFYFHQIKKNVKKMYKEIGPHKTGDNAYT